LEGTSGGHLLQPAKAALPKAGCQIRVQMAFEYLQGWRLHNLSGQPMPVLSQLSRDNSG